MKRTLVVLALAVLSCAGCRAMGPMSGSGCGATCAEPCGAPCGPAGCGDCCTTAYGRGGNLEESCPGGEGCLFHRYCGQNCDPGYPCGPYDCSPCGSPHWGFTGHRHPRGYRTGQECRMCNACGKPYACGPNGERLGHPPGPGYCCCGPAAPGCCNSGDHRYTFNPGPPTAHTAYPYYTLRGPRDFLLNNPPPLGPY